MKRRAFLKTAALAAAAGGIAPANAARSTSTENRVRAFELDEWTIPRLQEALQARRFSSVSLVEKYLARIREIDQRGPALRSVIEVNPDAAGIAAALDRERRSQGPRGPLHGIPILLKDNIDTHDRMWTTAGSLALAGSIPAQDSFVARRLREAGAVILGKTNLSEWANFRSTRPTSGWSGRGGQTRNPYVLDRNPSGSSSGSGASVAANLCAAAVGTETDGSIVAPSSSCGIVGIKPTVGLVSRSGIIPISASQDTAGPMARTVTDAAILLGAMAGEDSHDPATAASSEGSRRHADYTGFLDPAALKGARLGVARKCQKNTGGSDPVFEVALSELKRLGAEIVDPADPPTYGSWDDEFEVLLFEFKAGLNAYLAGLGPKANVKSLEELIQFNEKYRDVELRWFGQETLINAQSRNGLTDPKYLESLAKCRRASRTEGIDAVMDQHRLDALVAPTCGPAHVTEYLYGDPDTCSSTSPAAVAGYPSITVPAGFVKELPVGVSFFGRPWSEPRLLGIAFAFEQATQARRPPRFIPTLAN